MKPSDANGFNTSTTSKFSVPDEYSNHPGGQSSLISARRLDAKEIFFLTSHVGMDLDGRVAAAAKAKGIELPERGDAYNEIHNALRKTIQDHPGQVTIYRAWCLFLTLMYPLSILMFIITGSPYWAAAIGLSTISYSFNIFHMRHHRGGKVYGIDWLDSWTEPLYELLERMSAIRPENWRQIHNESHHLSTNDPTQDYDITNLFQVGMRLHPSLPFYGSLHPFQSIYIPILFALNGLSFSIDNVRKYAGHPIYFVMHSTLMFVLPTCLHGWQAFRAIVYVSMALGLIVSYLFQVSHNHSALASFNEKGTMKEEKLAPIDEFLRHQMSESVSWGGWLSCLLLGGINYQIEHHLAPAVPSPLYYHYISPWLREMAQRRNWLYVYEPTFGNTLVSYHQHLYRMSLPPTSKRQ